jgi:hypothetical protein
MQFIVFSYPTHPHPIKQSLLAFAQLNGLLHPQTVAHVPATSLRTSAKHCVVAASSTHPEAEKLKAKAIGDNNEMSRMEIIIVVSIDRRSITNMGQVKVKNATF